MYLGLGISDSHRSSRREYSRVRKRIAADVVGAAIQVDEDDHGSAGRLVGVFGVDPTV